MKRLFQWAMAATLICGAMVFTACTKIDNPVDGETGASGIAMIVKNGQIDYFRQIETAFRDVCQEKDLEAYYYATSAESAYEEQLAAVEGLRKLGGKAFGTSVTLRGVWIGHYLGAWHSIVIYERWVSRVWNKRHNREGSF